MNYFDIVNKTISYIEENIREEINIEVLSNKFNITKYYYCKVFKAVTGVSIITYVRRRKLSEANKELQNTNKTILEIALEYGYSSHSAFTKACKNLFNHNPINIRKNCKIDLYPKLTLMNRNFKNYKNNILVDFSKKKLTSLELWGVTKKINFDEPNFKKFIIDEVNKIKDLYPYADKLYFVVFPKSELLETLEFGIFTEEKHSCKNIQRIYIPESNYLNMKYTGEMVNNWANVVQDIDIILKNKNEKKDNSQIFFFEEYSIDSIELNFNIYLPIK